MAESRRHCSHEGCRQSFASEADLELHTEGCGYREANCPYCQDVFAKGSLARHMAEVCQHRLVPCGQCGDLVVFKQRGLHQETCPKKVTQCEQCGLQQTLEQLVSHLDICPKRILECEMKELGCGFTGVPHLVDQHCRDFGGHLKLLASAMKSMDEKVKEITDRNRQQEAQHGMEMERLKSKSEQQERQHRIDVERLQEMVRQEHQTRYTCVSAQQDFNTESELRLNQVETKVNVMMEVKTNETLDLTLHQPILDPGKTVAGILGILSLQLYRSMEVGGERIKTFYLDVDLDAADHKVVFDVELVEGKMSRCFTRYVCQTDHVFKCGMVLSKPPDLKSWPLFNRCMYCLVDATDGGLLSYMVKDPIPSKDNSFVFDGQPWIDNLNFRYGLMMKLRDLRSQKRFLKLKLAFIVYQQP